MCSTGQSSRCARSLAQRHTEHTPPHSANGAEKNSFSLSVSGHLLWVVLATELDRQDTGPFGKDVPVGMKLDGHKDGTWMRVTPGNAGAMGRQVKSTKHRPGMQCQLSLTGSQAWSSPSHQLAGDLGHASQLLWALFPSITKGAIGLDGSGVQLQPSHWSPPPNPSQSLTLQVVEAH